MRRSCPAIWEFEAIIMGRRTAMRCVFRAARRARFRVRIVNPRDIVIRFNRDDGEGSLPILSLGVAPIVPDPSQRKHRTVTREMTCRRRRVSF
jgi:hypothetical protein